MLWDQRVTFTNCLYNSSVLALCFWPAAADKRSSNGTMGFSSKSNVSTWGARSSSSISSSSARASKGLISKRSSSCSFSSKANSFCLVMKNVGLKSTSRRRLPRHPRRSIRLTSTGSVPQTAARRCRKRTTTQPMGRWERGTRGSSMRHPLRSRSLLRLATSFQRLSTRGTLSNWLGFNTTRSCVGSVPFVCAIAKRRSLSTSTSSAISALRVRRLNEVWTAVVNSGRCGGAFLPASCSSSLNCRSWESSKPRMALSTTSSAESPGAAMTHATRTAVGSSLSVSNRKTSCHSGQGCCNVHDVKAMFGTALADVRSCRHT
mmetsp:Transcript_95669/g.303722  ORF Transcript_95669/g.303722 Transcript_95669/m.303722 type:complete len:319 (-) Transcript_95669:170-1126(-)